jgi:hypothetical protein
MFRTPQSSLKFDILVSKERNSFFRTFSCWRAKEKRQRYQEKPITKFHRNFSLKVFKRFQENQRFFISQRAAVKRAI